MQTTYSETVVYGSIAVFFYSAEEDTILSVESVDLVSGATDQNVTGDSTWAAVKSTNTPTEYVLVEADIEPDVDPGDLPAGFITWTGGEAVSGNQLQRKVPKNVSAHTELVASCGGSSATGHVWILWATVENKTTGTTPANAVQFGTSYDGTENLGAQSYDGGTKAVGKVVPVGTITPAGVHDVVQAGWSFERERMSHDFNDGAKDPAYFDDDWQPDTSYDSFQNETPDDDDKIYDRDAPNIASFGNTDSSETYNNFREWIEWNNTSCSEYAYWYWKGRWKVDQSPQVTLKEVGTGTIDLPAEDENFYDPP